jgi:hypothetical protein
MLLPSFQMGKLIPNYPNLHLPVPNPVNQIW